MRDPKARGNDRTLSAAFVDDYKRTTIAQGIGDSKRDLALAHIAFYSGAQGVLRVLDQMLSDGDYDDLHETIARQGRAIRALRGRLRRPRIQ